MSAGYTADGKITVFNYVLHLYKRCDKSPRNSNHKRGEQVCYSYLFFTNEVKSYAENQDIADIRKIRQRKVGHKASDKYCDYCYDTLKNRYRYGGEDTVYSVIT